MKTKMSSQFNVPAKNCKTQTRIITYLFQIKLSTYTYPITLSKYNVRLAKVLKS